MMYNTSFSCLRLICLKGLKSANLGTSFSILTSDPWFTHFPLKKENKSDRKNKTKHNKENKESHKKLKNNNTLTGLSLVFEFPGTGICNCKEGYITAREFSFVRQLRPALHPSINGLYDVWPFAFSIQDACYIFLTFCSYYVVGKNACLGVCVPRIAKNKESWQKTAMST